MSLYNNLGWTGLIVDVGGWFTDSSVPAATGSRFVSLNLSRVLDTRYGTGGFSTPLGQDGTISLQLAGTAGVPPMTSATPPTAVVANVTIAEPTSASCLTVYSGDASARPTPSDLNSGPSQSVPNLMVVNLGAIGKLQIYNNLGSVDVIADVAGHYTQAIQVATWRLFAQRFLKQRTEVLCAGTAPNGERSC